MRRKAAVNFFKIMVAVIVTVSMVAGCAWLLHSKTSYHKMHGFYSNPSDYDVWFFGSSHVIMGTLPEELYYEYGIRSYNLAHYGQNLALDYWIAKNLLNLSKPKLIVLDVAYIGSEEKYSDPNIGNVKQMITSLPFGMEKVNAINDLFEGDLREEMLFPFAADHYNWEYLREDYFKQRESFELGSDQNVFDGRGKADYVLVTPTTIPDAIGIENADMTETTNSTYIRKLIELSQENGIDVLLVKSPLHTDTDTLKKYNHAFVIGQEYGVPYVNGFEIKEFDGDVDMWDNSHLNSLGGRKWTHILGQYICEHYPQIERTTDGTMKQRWDSRYDKYQKWLDTGIPLQSHLYSYIMLCTNPRYTVDISIKNGAAVINDSVAMKLVNLCSGGVNYVDGDQSDYDISISVKNSDGELVDTAYFNPEGDSYKRQNP